jgi:Cu/Ag efflux protein CusF
MKSYLLLVFAGIMFLPHVGVAQGHLSPDNRPSFAASHSATMTARVEEIDHETREVTLRFDNGDTLSTRVGDEVRNLAQVGVGDIVYTHYTESISIQVVEDDGKEPESFVKQDRAAAAKGRMPGMAATESVVTTAIVESIDPDHATVSLRVPDGEVRRYAVRNPDNLRRIQVGDKIAATATTSIVITVDKALEE